MPSCWAAKNNLLAVLIDELPPDLTQSSRNAFAYQHSLTIDVNADCKRIEGDRKRLLLYIKNELSINLKQQEALR